MTFGIALRRTDVTATRHQLHQDGLRVFAKAVDMRYGHALLTEQGENVRLPAQIREWTDIPTALAPNMQLKGFAIALQLKVPGRAPAQQTLHGGDFPAQ